MIFNLFLLLTFVLIGRPQEFITLVAPFRPALLLTVVLLVLIFLNNGTREIKGLFVSAQARKYGYFFLVMVIGIPFAYHRRIAFDLVLTKYLSNILFFYIAILQLSSYERLKRFLTAILFSVTFYSLFSLISGVSFAGRFMIKGSMFDPNDIAYVMVSLLPVSIYFLIIKASLFKKGIALAALSFSLALIFLSGSRGGVLGFGALFIVLIFTHNRAFKPSYKIAVLAVAAIVIVVYSGVINTDRYLSIIHLSSDYNITDEFGRIQIWKRALHLVLTNPITGVGVDCFPIALGYLRANLGIIPKWQAVHNSYLQVASEMGLVGFFIFLSLIVGTLKRFIVIGKRGLLSSGLHDFDNISALMLAGFVGHLVAAFFLTQAYSILFTLFFAMSVVLERLALVEMETQGIDVADSNVEGEEPSFHR